MSSWSDNIWDAELFWRVGGSGVVEWGLWSRVDGCDEGDEGGEDGEGG